MDIRDDILARLDASQETQSSDFGSSQIDTSLLEIEKKDTIQETTQDMQVEQGLVEEANIEEHLQQSVVIQEGKKTKNTFKNIMFFIKYLATSVSIFALLLLVSNYSAYWNIAKSVIYSQELEQTKKGLIESVAAANVSDETSQKKEADTFKTIKDQENIGSNSISQKHSLESLLQKNDDVSLDIEITPFENRIVIPKIGKNIPLLDITHPNVQGVDELNDIFMKELENGVIRYPGSAKPGDTGNAFIFGHSSNFPWMKGDYNDVFSLLDKVSFDDEVIVYYGQEKYIYKIRAKNVIRPGDVSVLKSNPEAGASEITLMTCWPIGTTLNRLILTGELIRTEK